MSEQDDPPIVSDDSPQPPSLGILRKGSPTTLHGLGDIHGWAPGLISYLIKHRLASISIDDESLGSDGVVDEGAMNRVFGRPQDGGGPPAGMRGFPLHGNPVNGQGHGRIHARWIADDDTIFVQIGDVFDRADHSEMASEILRQLIIGAPNRVFVLVGNHEQFMLEGDFANWYNNEKRNAVESHDDLLNASDMMHTRFLPNLEFQDPEERARETIFPCYMTCVLALYLTQAAAQQKSGLIDRGIEDKLVDDMLSPGWRPYLAADAFAHQFEDEGVVIPGALAALVIGENLFHHAEPGGHLNELPKKIESNQDIGWMDYTSNGGGNVGDIQGISRGLFWHRHASNGAFGGSPRMATEIDGIRSEWPGLYRIIHGHSPTVGVDEFTRAMGANIEAASCSYLAENPSTNPRRGVASGIRVYNIDEGMSPVYYVGSGPRDSPLRIPMGLREANEEDSASNVVVHSATDSLVELETARSVERDTRELWSWKPGDIQSFSTEQWNLHASSRRMESILEFDDHIWIVGTSQDGFDAVNRHVSGYPIIPNLVRSIMNDSGTSWNSPDNPPNALKYISSPVLGDVFMPLISGDKLGACEVAKALSLQAVGLRCDGDSTPHLATINFSGIGDSDEDTKRNHEIFVTYGKRGKFTLDFMLDSVQRREIKSKSPFSICSDFKTGRACLDFWLGETDEDSFKGPCCIAFHPEKTKRGKTRPELKQSFSWTAPKKQSVVEPDPIDQSSTDEKTPQVRVPKTPVQRMVDATKRRIARPDDDIFTQQDKLDSQSREPHPRKPPRDIHQQQAELSSTPARPKHTGPEPIQSASDEPPSISEMIGGKSDQSLLGTQVGVNELEFTLNNNEVNELLVRCGLPKRKQTQPDMRIRIFKVSRNGVTNLRILGQKEQFSWEIENRATPNCKKNRHGIEGRDLKKMIEHKSFVEMLRMHENGVDW